MDASASAASWGWNLRSGRGGGAGASGARAWPLLLNVGAAALVVLEFVQPVGISSPTLRATIETLMTVLALTAAWLVRGQFAHTRRLRELLLLAALMTLALTELFATALPAALHEESGGWLAVALPLGQLIAAGTLAVAARTPSDRLVTGGRRPVVIVVGLSLAGFGIAELAGLLLRSQLLAGARYADFGVDRALHHPLGFVVLLGTVGLFAYAGLEFARRQCGAGKDTQSALAGAAFLLAAARLYYLGMPWISPELVTLREGLRTLALALVLAAAVREDLRLRTTLTRAAARAERRRVAEDLHDFLVQDLALIVSHGARIAAELGAEHPVAIAATRALAVSRDTIRELSDMSSTPPREILEAVAHELRDRFRIAIAVHAQPDAEVAPEARDHLARITREAITNAARHGGAQNVVVSLKRTSVGVALTVCDDGCGIVESFGVGPRGGFGLGNMRDRATALGGSLTVRPRRAGGTELEVVFP